MNYYIKVFDNFPMSFYYFTIKSNTYNFNNMRFKVFLRISYFMQVQKLKMYHQTKNGHFLAQGLFIVV
jgi:hypothetical protein